MCYGMPTGFLRDEKEVSCEIFGLPLLSVLLPLLSTIGLFSWRSRFNGVRILGELLYGKMRYL